MDTAGTAHEILKTTDADEARFLEQTLEAALGIVDVRVAGELA